MTTLNGFFKESQSTLGVFYPKHYIIATFKAFATTELAAQALRGSGFAGSEVLAVPAEGVLKYFEEFHAQSTAAGGVMTMLSRAFGTEQVFADDDVQRAHAGAGFLAVHSPEEADKSRVQELLTPFAPIAMHWYAPGGVECLI